MKIIFLDVDGVLNAVHSQSRAPSGFLGVDNSKVKVLRELVDRTGAAIVLTSTWKRGWSRNKAMLSKDAEYLNRKLARAGLRIMDKTSDEMFDRGAGIARWIRAHQNIVEAWVVLDDDYFEDYAENGVDDHLVKTSFSGGGLMEKHIQQCVDVLAKGV